MHIFLLELIQYFIQRQSFQSLILPKNVGEKKRIFFKVSREIHLINSIQTC